MSYSNSAWNMDGVDIGSFRKNHISENLCPYTYWLTYTWTVHSLYDLYGKNDAGPADGGLWLHFYVLSTKTQY